MADSRAFNKANKDEANLEFERVFSKHEESQQSQVLDPNNPLLGTFQKVLKEYLLKQIDHLKDDIFEYECGTKKNNSKREELGVVVYEQQQVAQKQQKTIEEYISKFESTSAACKELENIVGEKKKCFKEERDNLFKAEIKEKEICGEIESVNLLINQISKWEDSLESDITVKKRIYEKSKKDKLKLLEEKRSQDALIYKLMTRIWQLEQELDKMLMQISVKEEEKEEMAQTVALGNTNIEAMEAEYRCLMHSWNSVIIAIGNRDKVLNCLSVKYNQKEEEFKSILSEIEKIKKLTQKEMRKNEELTMMKSRFLYSLQTCKASMEEELEKKTVIEARLNEMNAIIDQTERDIQRESEEANDTTNILTSLQKEERELDNLKANLEEKAIKKLAEEVTNNKTINSLQRILKQYKTTNREIEIQVAIFENKIASISSEIEVQKYLNFQLQQDLIDVENHLKNLGDEADKYQEEINQITLKIMKKQREVDFLTTKYQKLIEKSEMVHCTPLEMKINTLEKNIEEVLDENKKLQLFWLREQNNLIRISEERQEQIQTNNLLLKQILILEQKNLKMSDELEDCKKYLDKVLRTIKNFHSQLTVLGDQFVKTKGLKIDMDKDNEVLRQDYTYRLKDAELDCLKLDDEIAEIEEDKLSMSEELIELNRLVLEWEKKFLCAKETKDIIAAERGREGEVGSMKAEIHRMNVRYSQLKKVQDVLVQDLEQCVSRRDAIVTTSEAREKKGKGGMEKTRINFNRRLDDIKNKTKQLENQIEEMKTKINDIEKEKQELEHQINKTKTQIESVKLIIKETETQLEERKTVRQMNFELLLQIQRKLHIYTDVSKGRKPYLVYRSEINLATQYNKELGNNSKLSKIVENLQGDFPNHYHELNRILHTLKLPVYVYYQ